MVPTSFTRFLAVALVALSFSMIVWGAPVTADNGLVARGSCTVGCHTGTDTVKILTTLETSLELKLNDLDKCHDSGSDPSAVIADIAALINTSAVLIGKLDKDVLGLLNGQLVLITNMVIRITLNVATHCAKWSDKAGYDAFLVLCGVIDVALKALLSQTCGLVGVVFNMLVSLCTSANVALFFKVKFSSCIGFLGL